MIVSLPELFSYTFCFINLNGKKKKKKRFQEKKNHFSSLVMRNMSFLFTSEDDENYSQNYNRKLFGL